MRKKKFVNIAGKKDLDRQVVEIKEFEMQLKNQVGNLVYLYVIITIGIY